MFQTEMIFWLQKLAAPALTIFFTAISQIIHNITIVSVLMVVTYAVHFRFGLILTHAVIWNFVLTNAVKDWLALPRPFQVDDAVQLLGDRQEFFTPFHHRGAASFFGALPGDVVAYFRQHPTESFGFPSGHASMAVVLWGMIALWLRKRSVQLLALLVIVLIVLSRLYLGWHFPADLLGGLALGTLVLLLFYHGVLRNEPLRCLLLEKSGALASFAHTFFFFFYFLLLPVLLLLVPGMDLRIPPGLLGLNVAFLLLRRLGLPREGGTPKQRIYRVITAGCWYVLLDLLRRGLVAIWPGLRLGLPFFVLNVLHIFAFSLGATLLCFHWRLYDRRQ